MLDASFLQAEEPTSTQRHYQVLARRARPQSFAELIGQDVVSKTLGSMLESGRIPHAFLFTGTRGTGKTSSARILAKSLCCVNGPTLHPCQTCVHCVQITACAHEDVLEIDGASNTGVDQIRELRESARFYPSSSRFRIFVIDEVHMLSIGAFNALLKILEEPPAQVYFILATTELHKVPITVRSRCTIMPFRKIETELLAQHLSSLLEKENISFDNDGLMLIARAAKGSARDSLSLLEQVIALSGGKTIDEASARQALGLLGNNMAQSIFNAILAGDSAGALALLREADTSSLDLGLLLEETAHFFRCALIAKQVGTPEKALKLTELLPKELASIMESSEKTSAAALSEIYRSLAQAARELGRSKDMLSWAEIAVLDCVSRADWLSSGELLAALVGESGAPKRQTSSGPISSPRPSETQSSNPIVKPAAQPQPANNEKLSEVQEFSRLVACIEAKSKTLAAKLRNATLVSCSTKLIAFAETPSNRVYTQLSPSDAAIFTAALQEAGFAGAQLRGIEVPKAPQAATPSSEPSRREGATSKEIAQQQSARPLKAKIAELDVFDELPAPGPAINSVASLERSQKAAELKEKQKRILNLDSVKKLAEIATSLEIHPVNETENKN